MFGLNQVFFAICSTKPSRCPYFLPYYCVNSYVVNKQENKAWFLMFRSPSDIDAESESYGCGLFLMALLGLIVAVFLVLGAWAELVKLFF